MSKLIALKSGTHELFSDAWNNDFSNLKQQVLLFDQIGIFKLSLFYEALEESAGLISKLDINTLNKVKTIISELEWLRQAGVIFELKFLEEEFPNANIIKSNLGEKLGNAQYLINRVVEISGIDIKKVADETLKAELIKEQQIALLRFLAIIMETAKGVTAVTTFPYTEYTRELPNSQKSNVTQIVISKLPLPNNETPWEQIIDYRNDPENQKNLLNLRRWIRKISTENLPPTEIEEELEWLISEFQNHMKLHKMKTNTETIEVMVKAPLELIENLIKLKLSKIPEPLFVLKKRQINLMEAELNAPGREMAYIIKTRDNFQSQE